MTAAVTEDYSDLERVTRMQLNGEPAYLATTPGTQLEIRGRWCAGHGWMPWWLHNPLHRLRLLRLKATRPLARYVK